MKKVLCIIMLIILLIPFQVRGEEESTNGVEVSVAGGKNIYNFGDGHYLKIPLDIVIVNRDFDVIDIIETDIDLSKLTVKYYFDLEKDNNIDSQIMIIYKDRSMYFPVQINIKDYINIPNEIIVSEKNFDIWNYVETNILNKESIELVGNYDFKTNGRYDVTLKYNDIIKNSTIIVDIKESSGEKQEELSKNESNTCEKTLTSETNNYTNKYYTYNTYNNEEILDSISCPEINIPTPINKTIYNDNPLNDYFYYVTYAFYSFVVVLLSINVIRKK